MDFSIAYYTLPQIRRLPLERQISSMHATLREFDLLTAGARLEIDSLSGQ
jgi:hypothetical protein